MKKWMKSRKALQLDAENSLNSRTSFVRNQLRKIIGEIEKDVEEQDVWRTHHHKRSKNYFYPKFSYL